MTIKDSFSTSNPGTDKSPVRCTPHQKAKTLEESNTARSKLGNVVPQSPHLSLGKHPGVDRRGGSSYVKIPFTQRKNWSKRLSKSPALQ
jgi:hypothetical protein